jgi:hypothetical protein
MRLPIIILSGAILMSCSKGTKNSLSDKVDSTEVDHRDTAASENAFMEFVSLLPKVNLPFEINCERCCDHPALTERMNWLRDTYLKERIRLD